MHASETDPLATIREDVKTFPLDSGVYIMRDTTDTIIYIGKAKHLRNRVRSYFAQSAPVKVAFILKTLHSISYIVTSNEYEALLLENNLIKKHQPKFNVNLKDGKSYPVIRITNEEYPRIFKTRRIVEDGSEYFGPYPNVDNLNSYLEIIWKTLPLRRCKQIKPRKTPCLYHHIGRCAALCAGKIDKQEYHARIGEIRKLLRGSTKGFETLLEKRMQESAKKLQFERAQDLRDTLYSIRSIAIEQRIQDFNVTKRDYLSYVEENSIGVCVILHMQDGQMHGAHHYAVQNTLDATDDVIARCIMQHYEKRQDIPEVLFTSKELSNASIIQQWFTQQCNQKVRIMLPKNTQDARLVHMAIDNAWRERRKTHTNIGNQEALRALQKVLQLPKAPEQIEGFDIAHVGGMYTMGAMVMVENGRIDSKQHRLFRIKTLEPGRSNDVAAIKEVVLRRYMRLKNENATLPDLIVIDGGKGQLNSAETSLKILHLDIPVVAIAKREELLFSRKFPDGLRLAAGNPALRIVQMLRDEAHRFATGARSRAQSKDLRANVLLSIPGIGPRRVEKILKEFKHLSAVLEASATIVAKSLGISISLAQEVQRSIEAYLAKK